METFVVVLWPPGSSSEPGGSFCVVGEQDYKKYEWLLEKLNILYKPMPHDAPDGVVIPAVADTEGLDVREELVLGEGLEDPGGALQAGDGGAEGGGEAAGVDDGTPGTHHLHHLEQRDGSDPSMYSRG